MIRHTASFLSLLFLLHCAGPREGGEEIYDVVVYGGTSAGVIAAVQVKRMGRSVLLVEPGQHLGGLSSGGLGATDIGNKKAIGGLAGEFYHRIWKHYLSDEAWIRERRADYPPSSRWEQEGTWWMFEPHVAENVFMELLREADVRVVLGERLDLNKGVWMHEARITRIVMESGRAYQGRMFIDATYEGDLMAKAGVSYTVGREGNDEYGETLNGVQTRRARYHQFPKPVDPHRVPGDPSSGLLPGIHEGGPGAEGEGDHRVQAYNFRMCLTDVEENRVPFPKPDGYDPARYELLLRYPLVGRNDVLGGHRMMPNHKSDTNNCGALSTDNIGMNYAYPDGDYETRRRIVEEHETYQKGLMWFLANDPRVPKEVRDQVGRWGLAMDEFEDNGNWPRQLYIREARRMISAYVMTEQNCRGERVAEDPVGLGAYGMDSHNTQRYVDEDGYVRNEGDIQVHGFSPYPVSYRSIVPRASECENLLVPVCVSASHIAFGSIRMEPVFMILGQSAATAAVHALEEGCSPQKIDYTRLKQRLLGDGQVLEWPPRVKLGGLVMDDEEAELTGEWIESSSVPLFVGRGYRHDDNEEKGSKKVRFQMSLPEAGLYEIRISYAPHANRASSVPVSVYHGRGSETIFLNQKLEPPIEGLLVSLGTFFFDGSRPAVVEVSNAGTDGHVIADAVQIVRVH